MCLFSDLPKLFSSIQKANQEWLVEKYEEVVYEVVKDLLVEGIANANIEDYYLRRNYLKEEETAGSIYIDGNNSPDLDYSHTLIYGHNMRNLSMFGNLKFYKTEEDYFENTNILTF